ncbi:MAG: arsenate reductase (glutaredoxin) [Gammaproteobacteria bacterium]|nr:arsenate reductase (glutaredoxin) [Gammaproteobacteria bacterium]
MSEAVRIFHNPRCSKSRQTMEILNNNNADVSVVEYLKSPPGSAELNEILDMLGMEPRDLMRKNEKPYKENQLDNPQLTREQLIQAMVDNPVLIERPIVICGNKAVIGRPPEKVMDILS